MLGQTSFWIPARLIPIYAIEFGFWIFVGWSWIRWWQVDDPAIIPRWRRQTLLVGFGLATFSTLLDVFMGVHAILTGGYPYYHPVELFCIRYGSLASLVAFVAACVGKGRLRVATFITSILTLFFWFADAMAQ